MFVFNLEPVLAKRSRVCILFAEFSYFWMIKVKMSQVSLNEEDGLDSETINEEEDDSDDEEGMKNKGGKLKRSESFYRQSLYHDFAMYSFLLEECKYGNCPKCFCWSVVGLRCPIPECDSTIVNFKIDLEPEFWNHFLNPLLLSLMLSETSIVMSGLCNPYERVPSIDDNVERVKMFTSNVFPKEGVELKAHQVLDAIIYMEPKFISENNKHWLKLVSKQIDMKDTNQFGKQETQSCQNTLV